MRPTKMNKLIVVSAATTFLLVPLLVATQALRLATALLVWVVFMPLQIVFLFLLFDRHLPWYDQDEE